MSNEETIKRNLDYSPKCSISKCERPPIGKYGLCEQHYYDSFSKSIDEHPIGAPHCRN